jgi:hypothetical protein
MQCKQFNPANCHPNPSNKHSIVLPNVLEDGQPMLESTVLVVSMRDTCRYCDDEQQQFILTHTMKQDIEDEMK